MLSESDARKLITPPSHALLSDPRKLRWEELKAPEGLSKSAPTLNPPVMLGYVLMQGRNVSAAGCTESDAPYTAETLSELKTACPPLP